MVSSRVVLLVYLLFCKIIVGQSVIKILLEIVSVSASNVKAAFVIRLMANRQPFGAIFHKTR